MILWLCHVRQLQTLFFFLSLLHLSSSWNAHSKYVISNDIMLRWRCPYSQDADGLPFWRSTRAADARTRCQDGDFYDAFAACKLLSANMFRTSVFQVLIPQGTSCCSWRCLSVLVRLAGSSHYSISQSGRSILEKHPECSFGETWRNMSSLVSWKKNSEGGEKKQTILDT